MMTSEKQQSLLAMASTFPFSFYNPVLQLKAVAEGNSRLFSLHHHHHHHQQQQHRHSPPPIGLSPPGTQSMLCSPPVSTSREQAARLHHHLHQEHQKSLKFSIDNILSPSFGAAAPPSRTSAIASDERTKPVTKREKREKHATSKRKYSSDSESSNSSSNNSTLSSRHKSPKKEEAASSATSAITGSSTTSSISSQSSTSSSAKSSSKGSDDSDPVHVTSQGPNPLLPFPLDGKEPIVWPAWVYCTRYSDRPSSGPRSRRTKKSKAEKKADEKRPRTAFTAEQLARLKEEFQANRYLTEKRRQDLARDLKLNESQIKIWFQNKRAKIKKTTGARNPLALHLMAQGLYNHTTASMDGEEDDDEAVDVDDGTAGSSPSGNQMVSSPGSMADHSMSSEQ